MSKNVLVVLLLAVSTFAQTNLASNRIDAARMKQYADLAQQWEIEYLQVDTTNPPGNEMRAVEFYKKVLDAEGIENQVIKYDEPHNRGNLWAVLPGSGKKRPLILLNHMDVVSSDPQRWKHPPFSAAIDGGYIYGRGAQDMKSEGLAQLVTMVMLKREKVQLDRDVIFLAVADEEAEGTGTDWMIANRRDLLRNAEYLINEGGYNVIENGKVKYVGVDVAEKTTYWLRVTAHGKPGHGSQPMPDSAPNRLIAALTKLIAYQTPLKLTPTVEEWLKVMAAFEKPERAEVYRNIRKYLNDPKFIASLPKDDLNPKLRNTIQLTMLGGSQQTNVIPGEAWAQLDIRMLPGEDPEALRAELVRVVNDPNVTIEPVSKDFRKANFSPTNTEIYAAFRKAAAAYFGNAPVAPYLTGGYTENQRYREIGIESYGFSPYAVLEEVSHTEHGDDERIAVDEVRRGFRVLYDVVNEVAGAKVRALKVTNVVSGGFLKGGKPVRWSESTLLIRVDDDGAVKWEEPTKTGVTEHASHLTDEQLKKFTESLRTFDPRIFSEKMGPFATYTDTGVELKVESSLTVFNKSFLVTNPWPCDMPSCGYSAYAMPKDLERFLCIAEQIRNTVDPAWQPRLCKNATVQRQ